MFNFWRVAHRTLILCLVAVFILAACQPGGQATEAPTATLAVAETPAAPPTAVPTPTPTQIPTAAIVNDEAIPLDYFESEVLRYKDGLDPALAAPAEGDIRIAVLNTLVDQLLLSQEARRSGFSLDEAALQQRIDGLVAQLGSGSALTDWMAQNHYTDSTFRHGLKTAAEAAWQRDAIISAVPEAMEQVRVQQILTTSEADAKQAYALLNSGSDFGTYAWRYSPQTGGELGWFPRGYLLHPAVEEAAFNTPVGTYSDVVQSEIGYHILYVLERSDSQPLTTDARVALQNKAMIDWVTAQRAAAVIESRIQ